MKASSANLLTIIKGPKQFVIPIYQRTYSWQLAHCDKLFSDIIRISRDPKVEGHFIGSVVYFQESIHTVSDVPKLLVIDGQQRLTTISILIAAIANFIEKNEEVEVETTLKKLKNYYLLNAEEEDDLRFKLLLTRRDKDTLIKVIQGIPLKDPFSQRVAENYNFFLSKLSKENVNDVYNGLLRLFIVDVALEKDKDNPQLIFESLNSTGLDLSQADLIRNYILMGQDIKIQTELYEKHWYPMEQSFGNEYSTHFDWFIRDYLSVKTGRIPKIGYVYDFFKDYEQSNKSPDAIEQIVEDIHQYSGYYVNIVLLKEPDQDLKEAFRQISRLKVDVSYPFLLPVYHDYSNGDINKEEFLTIINLVENYVFRRAICGIPTNSLNKTFATLYKLIHRDHYLESIKVAFQELESYKRFPSDAEFEKELMVKDVYNFRNKNYLLSRLENFNRKEKLNVDEYTIEHIMPQNPELSIEWQEMLGENWQEVQEKYLHTLGNLTLTGYNSELSDKHFSRKKTIERGFNDSPIRLNEYLRKIDVWNEEHIQLRAKELTEKAKKVWFAPNLPKEILDKYKPEVEETTQYTIDHYEYLQGEIFDLYMALRKRILNIDPSVKEEYKKLYIAFKSSTNFVDIVPQKSKLRLSLNMEYWEIIDPKSISRDITGLGRWGNGDVEVNVSNINQLDDMMDLIQQAFDKQMEFN